MKLTKLASLLLGCLGAMSAAPGLAASAGWWNDRWETRVPITVETPAGVLRKRPVVLRWDTISKELPDSKVALGSLRLVSHGELVPFQVDHRDANGDFLPPGNLTLDAQDELVFVCPSGRKTSLHIYFSQNPRPPTTFPSGVKAVSVRAGRGQAHQILSTAGLKIGVQGTGLPDLSANAQANHGRGSVVRLTWKGIGLNAQGTNWSAFIGRHPFPTSEENRWRVVKLLVDGPVRSVLCVNCKESTTTAKDGSVVLRANVTRYFSMFDGVPLYDVDDIVRCPEVQTHWTGTYTDKYHAGRNRDEHDTLWDGSSGSVRRFPLADKDIAKNHTGGLVSTEKALDRWYAWFDRKERMGLTVFYGHSQHGDDIPLPARIHFEAGWEMWSTANRMSFVYANLKAPILLRHRFRVIGLDDVSPEQVAEEYRLWCAETAGFVTLGEVESR